MKVMLKGVAALAVIAAAGASTLHAQTGVQFGLGGGITTPLGNLNDYTKTGYHGLVTVGFQGPASLPIGFRIDGIFQRLGRTDGAFATNDQALQTIGGIANGVFTFKTSETSVFRPYIIGGVGYYNTKTTNGNLNENGNSTGSNGDVGINGGVGFNFVMGHLGLFLEGRIHHLFSEGNSKNFVPVTLGVKFGG